MKPTLLIAFLFFASYWGEHEQPLRKLVDPTKFDEWHDLHFSDEKARLDNVSLAWKAQSQNLIYLVIYAGRTACVDEAKARGLRAKDYLIKRHVPAAKIVSLDGGWRSEVTTGVWLWPTEIEKPLIFSDLNIKRADVKLEKGCRIKYRGTK